MKLLIHNDGVYLYVMLKVVIILFVLDLINAFFVRRKAESIGLNANEWLLISLFLFVLAWIPLRKQTDSQTPAGMTAPPLATPMAAGPGQVPPAPILTPLPKPRSNDGVSLTQFKPKSEITAEEYATGREKRVEVAPTVNVKKVGKRRKKHREVKPNVVDVDMVKCPNCSHQTYPNTFKLCTYCGARLG